MMTRHVIPFRPGLQVVAAGLLLAPAALAATVPSTSSVGSPPGMIGTGLVGEYFNQAASLIIGSRRGGDSIRGGRPLEFPSVLSRRSHLSEDLTHFPTPLRKDPGNRWPPAAGRG